MNWKDRIVIDPGVLVGKPIIRGTRIAVEFIVELLAEGWTHEQILGNYPQLTDEDFQAALHYASEEGEGLGLCRVAIRALESLAESWDNAAMTQHQLQKAVRQTKIERARELSFDDRLAAGARLYAEQCELVRDLIVGLHPDWSDQQVDAEMARRRTVARDRNSRRFYRTADSSGSLHDEAS